MYGKGPILLFKIISLQMPSFSNNLALVVLFIPSKTHKFYC
jgi:hypothetical protein